MGASIASWVSARDDARAGSRQQRKARDEAARELLKRCMRTTRTMRTFIIMDYEGIMDIVMKTLCVLGISYRHGKIAQVLWPKTKTKTKTSWAPASAGMTYLDLACTQFRRNWVQKPIKGFRGFKSKRCVDEFVQSFVPLNIFLFRSLNAGNEGSS